MSEASKEAVEVLPGYHSAVNEIIEPDKVIVLSRYFVRRWMPILGENGTRIVLALRSLGYYNRQTGEKRDGVEIDLPELASLCGISLPTLKREFGERHDSSRKAIPGSQQNPALHKFVTKDRQYWRDPVTNRLLRTANIYRVMMDDPLHDDDLPRLQEILEAREKGGIAQPPSKAHIEPKPPRKHGQPQSSKAHFHTPNVESESKKTHFHSNADESESPAHESEPPLIEYFSGLQIPKETSQDAASAAQEFLTSSSPEKKEPKKSDAGPWQFELLPDNERLPWLERAEQELQENFGLAVWQKTKEKAKASIRAQRAANLYLAEGKAEGPQALE